MKELRQAQAQAKSESSGQSLGKKEKVTVSSTEAQQREGQWAIWKSSAEEEMYVHKICNKETALAFDFPLGYKWQATLIYWCRFWLNLVFIIQGLIQITNL